MYTPETFTVALILVIASMFCWGSWPNFLKAAPKWRLEYFYLDYAIGFLIAGVIIGTTLGSRSSPGAAFFTRMVNAGHIEAGCAVLGGLLWCLGNILMLNAIVIVGMAVAYPISMVPAVVLGVGISYYTQPIGNPIWLAGSVILLLIAGFTNARACGRLGGTAQPKNPKGVKLALMCGIMVGIFPPFVSRAITGANALDSYTVSVYFMLGAFLATLIAVPILLARPLVGNVGRLKDFVRGRPAWHLLGILAGIVWSIGTMSNFLAAKTVGMAISWGVGSGAPMVGALWGILLWKEFAHGDSRAKMLITASLLLYVAGVAGVALAYMNA